tara:strand:+ start:1257 stop:1850 length:594 start_codon:yes stop_codon:yes gene_type:complete
MTERKKRLLIFQLVLFFIGLLIILFSYSQINKVPKNVSNQTGQIEIKTGETDNSDTFLNITYSGLDLSGNRYFLKSKEAIINKENQKIINMKGVEATFYFKDGTTLEVFSKIGVYNNETLDIDFQKDVKAFYQESILFSERAQFSNQNGFLTVTDEVKVIDPKGNLEADKLIFDIKKKMLDIVAFDNDKVNANISLK